MRRRSPKAVYALRFYAKIRGHSCDKSCEARDLSECFESRWLRLGLRTLEGARATASVLAVRGNIEGSDFRLVRVPSSLEAIAIGMAVADEWSEPVREPEHLRGCYETETGSLQNPETFWVCGPRCPTVLAKGGRR